jgi:hypothetical protein
MCGCWLGAVRCVALKKAKRVARIEEGNRGQRGE